MFHSPLKNGAIMTIIFAKPTRSSPPKPPTPLPLIVNFDISRSLHLHPSSLIMTSVAPSSIVAVLRRLSDDDGTVYLQWCDSSGDSGQAEVIITFSLNQPITLLSDGGNDSTLGVEERATGQSAPPLILYRILP
jgi:hypothetical protein